MQPSSQFSATAQWLGFITTGSAMGLRLCRCAPRRRASSTHGGTNSAISGKQYTVYENTFVRAWNGTMPA